MVIGKIDCNKLTPKKFTMESSQNPFAHLRQTLQIGEKSYQYYNLQDLKDDRLPTLPYSIRVLLEAAVRNCDNFNVKRK